MSEIDMARRRRAGLTTPVFWRVPVVLAVIIAMMATAYASTILDLKFSQWFFRQGSGFIHANDAWVIASYEWAPLTARFIFGMLVLSLALYPLVAALLRKADRVHMDRLSRFRHVAAISVICGALGPGLIIEGGFKQIMCRPRPVQVTAFGGDASFQAFPQVRRHPEHHRSFVSSHAAAGFWLMSLGLTADVTWRRRWLAIGIAAGVVIGFGRILQGGHFLTDVIFAFFAVWIPCEIVRALDQRRQERKSAKWLASEAGGRS